MEDEKLVLEAIDVKRVRAGRRGARQLIKSLTESGPMKRSIRKEESVPLAIKRFSELLKSL